MGSTRGRAPLRAALVAVAASVSCVLAVGCSTSEPAAGPSTTAGDSSAASPASAAASPANPSRPAATTPANGCGAQQVNAMTLRQRLAQLIVVGVTGAADARAIVAAEQIGGVFVGSWTDKSILTSGAAAQISKNSKIPLMITVDQEGGRVSRLSSLGIDGASPRELARTKTPEQVTEIAAEVGRKLKALGVTVDFAPVADVSDEADDEVIGDRSFSSDPAVVTKYAGAYAAGLLKAGIQPVFKHFPGHGHGSGDSHLGVVRTPPLSQLKTSDLIPYQTLLRDYPAAGVMVGHLIVPGLTGPETPASISGGAIGMLRTGKRYGGPPFTRGVVFSDDLSGMAAINQRYPIQQAVLKFVKAGGDVALWLSTDAVGSVLDTLEGAVASGALTNDRVNRSVVRILRAKGVIDC